MNFFSKLPTAPLRDESEEQRSTRFKRMQWASFFAITLGYSMYYVCRTSLNVVKKPIMDAGVLDAKQLGVISSALLFTYAIGKFVAFWPTTRISAGLWLLVCSYPPWRIS